MGRGGGSKSQVKLPPGINRRVGDIDLKRRAAPPDIGSEAHRERLLVYARQRTRRRDITLELSHFCGRCRHDYEDHAGGGEACTHSGCDCRSYLPGGGSFTDMKGNITIQTDVPPDGPPEDRELCIRGLLRHELCHEERTDPAAYFKFVKELNRMRRDGKEITASQLKKIHNILEDGMIESHERDENPGSYEYIAALNRLFPAPGEVKPLEKEQRVPAPADYVPVDADGNELPIETDAAGRKWVVAPAGARIGPWGSKPMSPASQMTSALLAAAVPGYEVGELHPEVAEALEECRPHIEAAVTGNTADCIVRAEAIHRILRRRGLLREDLTDEERQQLEDLAGAMGQAAPSAPDADPDAGDGDPAPAQNGVPAEGQGGELGDELKEQLGGGASGGKDEQSGDGQGAGSAKDGDESADGEGDVENGPGGDEAAGGYRPDDETPQKAEGAEPKEGKISDERLDELREEARKEIEADKRKQTSQEEARIKSGKIEGDDWDLPDAEHVTPQREMSVAGHEPLPEEQADLQTLGRRLGQRLARARTEARAPQRHRRRGKLDHRRLGAAMAGNPNVFYKPGVRLNLDMEIDVSIDRSGSVAGDRFANTNQYRMAKMFAVAARETKVPMSIYGWDGGRGNAHHYAYKESHSDDMRGVDALLNTGGGGTPTAEGVRFARARLGRSKAKQRVMVVITDGAANDVDAAAQQVKAAQAQGIRVLGMAFTPDGDAGSVASYMDRQFGAGSWIAISDYRQAPQVVGQLIEDAARKAILGLPED